MAINAHAYGDGRAFSVEHASIVWLFLLDRSCSSPSLWRRIDDVGGRFALFMATRPAIEALAGG